MKKLFLAISLMLAVVTASAQYVSDQPLTVGKGKVYNAQGQRISDEAAVILFSDINGQDLSEEYLYNRTRYRRALGMTISGPILIGVASVTAYIGLILTATTPSYGSVVAMLTGASLFIPAGVVLTSIGIPNLCSSSSHIKSVVREYNAGLSPRKDELQLTFGRQSSGVGFALNF